MAKRVTLFLIRHGETVDNVAQVYAGSRDSALTVHGHQQATRLGRHLSAQGWSFTHIFASPLQRAAKTAGLIRDAQLAPVADNGSPRTVPHVVQLPLLVEQDFGFYEGKKFHERPADGSVKAKDVPGFVDVESKHSLAQRADAFLDGHLLPTVHAATEHTQQVVAVVSHGIMLSALWKRLLLRLPAQSVTLSAELAATARPSLEHLGGWSNTGYLELYMTHEPVPGPTTKTTPPDTTASPAHYATPSSGKLHGWTTVIKFINGKDHLQNLKRTGGGVGSSRHDGSQKNIDSFFKRRKVD